MEFSAEERIDLALAAQSVVESAILKLEELKGDDSDPLNVEFETILNSLEKYCKNQIRLAKGY